MRIMLLAGSLVLGGAEKQMINLANTLATRGHEVTMVVIRPRGLNHALRFFDPLVNVHCLNRSRKYDFRFLWKLIRLVSKQHPDVLHSYLASANIVSAMMRPFFEGYIVWGIRSARRKPDNRDPLGRWRTFLTSILSTVPDLFISNSVVGRTVWVEQGIAPDKIVVIPNGVDVQEYRVDEAEGLAFRKSLQISRGETAVGIVASLRPVKDHTTFLHMAAELFRRDEKYVFVIVGDGDQSYARNLERYADNLGIGQRVYWLGRRAELRAVYNGIDVLVSASTAEGFSNVVAESMACGTPAVVTEVGDSAVIVCQQELVAPSGDWTRLADSVEWAATAMQSGLLSAGVLRERITSRYALDLLAPRTESALQCLLERNRSVAKEAPTS